MDKFSYAIGLGIGQNLLSMGAQSINVEDFAQAIKDVLDRKETAISHNEAREIVNKYFEELETKLNAENIEKGKSFLEENAKRPGVVTLPSGLQYEVITEGNGKKPSATDRVKCHYEGTLIDGTLFDSSIKRGEPAIFGVNQVIKGWVEALQLMTEGAKWKLFIPSELAYGAQQAGEMIPPHSTLIFEVELIEVLYLLKHLRQMKKISFFVAIAAAASLASCTAQAPKANMKNDVDSLSYMMGITNTQGLDMYMSQQLGVDTAYMSDFIRGVKEGTSKTSPKDVAYMAGLQIGQQVGGRMFDMMSQRIFGNDSTQSLSKENFLAGFMAALQKKGMNVTMEEANAYVQSKAEAIKAKATEAQFAENKAAGEKFLAENAKKEGVKTTSSGLQYKIIKEGNGAVPTDSSKVKVNYKGTLIDGTQFDSSYDRKEPTTFRANQVIKGWTEALTMMPVGSKWELYIPQDLAYGAREAGQIKPFSTLIFEVELVGIEK